MARLYSSRKQDSGDRGAGFLGSHLIDRLLAEGHEVLCADNLFTGAKRNIAHLHAHPRFEFMRHDVTFPLFVEVDEVYNLACQQRHRRFNTNTIRGADDKNVGSWRNKYAWSCETAQSVEFFKRRRA